MIPIFKGYVKEGRLTLEKEKDFRAYLYRFNSEIELIIRKPKKDRSNDQNAYYWGVIIQMIADETKNDPDDIHEFLRLKFLTKTIVINGVEEKTTRSTTQLSTVEFEEYLLNCRTWASEFLGMTIPLPNEVID